MTHHARKNLLRVMAKMRVLRATLLISNCSAALQQLLSVCPLPHAPLPSPSTRLLPATGMPRNRQLAGSDIELQLPQSQLPSLGVRIVRLSVTVSGRCQCRQRSGSRSHQRPSHSQDHRGIYPQESMMVNQQGKESHWSGYPVGRSRKQDHRRRQPFMKPTP